MTSFAGSRTIPMARTELRLFLIADHIVCWLKNFYLWINNWNNIFFNKNRGEKIPPAIIEITFANSLAYLPSYSCKQACSQIGHFLRISRNPEKMPICGPADKPDCIGSWNLQNQLSLQLVEVICANFYLLSFVKWNHNKHSDLARWN